MAQSTSGPRRPLPTLAAIRRERRADLLLRVASAGPGCLTPVRTFARYCTGRDMHFLELGEADIAAFLTEARATAGPAFFRSHRRVLGRLYALAYEEELVPPQVAEAAGVDPMVISADHSLLREALEASSNARDERVLRLIAAYFTALDKRLLDGSDEAWAAFDAELVESRDPGFLPRDRGCVQGLRERIDAARRLAEAIAVGADPVAVSPDRELLLEVIARHDGDVLAQGAITTFAREFGRRGRRPSRTTVGELRSVRKETQPASATLRMLHHRVQAEFYALAARSGQAAETLAVAAGVDPLVASPHRVLFDQTVARAGREADTARTALRLLVLFLLNRGRQPCDAGGPDLHAFAFFELAHLDAATREAYALHYERFYGLAHRAGLTSQRLLDVARGLRRA